ncbi:MAG TPA: AAA family ATPase [Anaerolineae bacterium]|nr:AAA family ATPase [Anaerolineae bacterium]HNU03667.1 AAA family ATPase [Anaerolineae bacterium]
MPELRLLFFGPPRIERHGAPVEIDTRKAVAALAYLALASPSGTLARDSLTTLLYPEYSQERARAAFRRTLSALRSAIGADCLKSDREIVSLALKDGVWCDVLQFQALNQQRLGHGHDAGQLCTRCLPLLQEAAALYGGDFLAGFSLRDSVSFDDWQLMQSERWQRDYAAVLELLVHGLGGQRQWRAAIDWCRRWIEVDPLHEPAHRRLMQLYAWEGQRSAALRQYRECVRVLDTELGVAPLPETTRLYQAIIEGSDPARLPGGDDWQIAPTAAPARPATSQPLPPASAAAPPAAFGLVGRQTALAALHEAWRAAGNGQIALIKGEAGIGKTRLANEFLCAAAQDGAPVIAARCYEGDARLAYGPLVDALRMGLASPELAARLAHLPALWLSEVRRLTPEVASLHPGLAPPAALDGPGAQARFFEGIAQAFQAMLAGSPPGVLLLDELQWADQATLEVLAFLARRLHGKPLLVLGALRSEFSAAAGAVGRLALEQMRAGHGTEITLERLAAEEVAELATQAGLPDLPADLAARLFQETEGLPLFVVEYLAGLRSGRLPGSGDPWQVPAGVRQALEQRLAQVDEIGRQLLTAAAVIGRSFPVDLLRAVSGRGEEETVAGLEALAALGLIRELRSPEPRPEPRYDFVHEQLRRVIYDDASLARRRLLHRRAADALIHATAAPRLDARASQIASHLQAAGSDAEAALYYRLAGEHARGVFANGEAIGHFEAALALGHPAVAELHEAIGDLLTLQGAYTRAVMAYETAAALNDGQQHLARLEQKLGLLHLRQGRWELADSRFAAAEHAATDADAAWRAGLLADWSLCAHRQGHWPRAAELAGRALALADSAADAHAQARAYNVLGILARSQGDRREAGRRLEESLAAARRLDDLPAQIAALNNLALAEHDSHDDAAAQAHLLEALALCQRVGDLHRQAAIHNNLADLLHTAGQREEAMVHLKQAVAIFAAIGDPSPQPADWQPEIWKLVEW